MKKNNGFTLIEVLITISIFSVIGISLFSTFSGGISIWKREKKIGKAAMSTRIGLEKITKDFRNMISFSPIKIIGNKHYISFPGMIKVSEKDSGQFYKIGRISYFYNSSKKVLYRDTQKYKTKFEKLNKKGKKILNSIEDFTFKYYIYNTESKEYSWEDEWDGEDENLFFSGINVEMTSLGMDNLSEVLSKKIFLTKERKL